MTIIASASVPEQHRLDVAATQEIAAHAAALSLTPQRDCPAWCVVHCPGDDGAVLHLSDDRSVTGTAGGPNERTTIHVTVEQLQRPGRALESASVRVDDNPMAPDEALALAAILVEAARSAMERAR
jgi:hypothetical protein